MTELSATRAANLPRPGAAAGRLARMQASRWLPLPVLLAGTFVIVLDFFIVNVALPSLQRQLHAGSAGVEWVVAGYALSFATLLLASGRLGDRIGRRRMFGLGIAVFTAASLGCGIAPSMVALVLARVGQGVGGAMLAPSVLGLLGTLYDGPDRARAIGAYATVMGAAAAGGQLIGGLLLQIDVAGLGWRSVFLINVPIGIVVLAALPWCVPPSRAASPSRLDWFGLLLGTAALTALVLPLLDGRQQHWPAWSVASLAASPALLTSFVAWQRRVVRRGGSPVVVPGWFRDRSFRVGMLTQFGFWCGQASYFLVLVLYLQFGRGLSALQSGLTFSILAAAYVFTSARAPRLVARFGRAVIVLGAALLAVGHLGELAAVVSGGQVLNLTPGLLLSGAGMGLCLAPITTIVLSTIEPQRAAAVGGLLSATQQVGNTVGVAIVGVVFFSGVHRGYGHAFELSAAVLAGLLATVAVVAARLPGSELARLS